MADKPVGKKYQNSPIVEAVCEFLFMESTPWDLTIPGFLYERIKDKLPLKEEQILQQIQMDQNQKGEIVQAVTQNKTMVFLSDDRQCFAQVNDRRISIHTVKPYISWTRFKPLIANIFDTTIKLLTDARLQRIGLRYINRIETPAGYLNMSDYFDFGLRLGGKLPQHDFIDFLVGCVFPFENQRDFCRVQSARAVSESNETNSFVLDIDYSLQIPDAISTSQALEWIESAHNTTETIFEGCITDKLRELFKEVP